MKFYKSIFLLAIFLSAFACGVRQKNNGTSDKKEIDILVLDHKNATKADSLASLPIANKKEKESIVEEISSW
jgi:hypothetical protein